MSSDTSPPNEKVAAAVTNRRVLIGSLSGSAIEWYDFLLYASVAPIIFNKQFFGVDDPFLALMLAYFGNLLTFVVRPFGGAFFAHIGDRVGRKVTLVATLTIMGLGTVAIGLLPTYAQIGMAAPILLYTFRVLQGLAIGGEWGGALLLAYEYAPKHRRGFFGSIPQIGVTVGLLLGNGAVLLANLLPNEQFESWGWRIPFVASIVLVFIGLWIRKGLDETPSFKAMKKKDKVAKIPLVTAFTKHWRAVLVAVGTKAAETAPFYIFVTFIIAYATGEPLNYDRADALSAVLWGALVASILVPLFGKWSDTTGRRPMYMIGVAVLGVIGFVYFMLVETGSVPLLIVASILGLGIAWAPVTATLGTMMSETFSAEVRYTGVTLGYQIGSALFSGTAPMIAVALVAAYDGSWVPVAIYMAAICAISFVAAYFAKYIAIAEDHADEA
ncbi:MFS transporter [Tessaracoccus caeni]|uniref:MFS transporter n=1 Tax=Tessaracoccus caeni TaxID=3031239 RepID=UPI0023DC3491|nr:MFS transporter [Tessaracoccus caeni]MDF1486765.1 MFS transporter [Tessaracoccus caeni]